MRKITIIIIFLIAVAVSSCAAKAGDKVDCPECNNETEILVGTKCVPIEDVDECGPDGHSHGEECHCFSSQEVTVIGEKPFCLQQGCGETNDTEECDEEHDHEDHDHEDHDHEEHEDHDEHE